jgi:hypothetical protein
MIVPQFWAEARLQQTRTKDRGQITVRRFGWSETSQAEAEQMAAQRAQEALARLASGEKLLRREPKIGYNGAQGVPIREEVLARHGDVVITRNSYGAHCLNTPDVVFADVDFNIEPTIRATLWHGFVLILIAAATCAWLRSGIAAFIGAFVVLIASQPFARLTSRLAVRLRGGVDNLARTRITAFVRHHPTWHLRLYRTPAGLRVLVMQQPFAAHDPQVKLFFDALGVDPVYARMCANQDCFRARLTPKPWRIGIGAHMRPRPGIWPVHPDRRPMRDAWIRDYEAAAGAYAACHFLESLGSGDSHPKTEIVREIHDRESQALSGRKLA